MHGVNPPDMPRTPMLSGKWRKMISRTDRALSPQTHIKMCTSFISSMVCTVIMIMIMIMHMIISAKTWRHAINYWELHHKKAVNFKKYMHIVFTSCNLFSSSIKLKKMCLCFSPPPPDIKRNLYTMLLVYHPRCPPLSISEKGEKHIGAYAIN